MKRFWLVLLSLGLIVAFSASAFAVDVKFSGSYYIAGMYLEKTAVQKAWSADDGLNTAFYFQRLRVQTEFVVSPGLSLITSIDALERVIGGKRSDPGATADGLSAGTKAENQNIAFDNAYVSYASPIGLFRAGMMWGGPWGWQFGNTTAVKNRFLYWTPDWGGFSVIAVVDKGASAAVQSDRSYTTVTAATQADNDQDLYGIGPMYNSKYFQIHVLGVVIRDATGRTAAASTYNPATTVGTGYTGQYYLVVVAPSVTVGPVRIEAEVDYYVGDIRKFDTAVAGTPYTKVNSYEAYLGAKANLGPAYVGGFVAYSQGQEDQNFNKDTLNQLASGGSDWNPCLIMFNYDLTYWQGGIANINGSFLNAWMYQFNGGVKPTDKLDIGGSVTYASRDTVLPGYDKSLGWEFDVTATYKITNNLSYMLGAGYLFTGDYFKGAFGAKETRNDFLVINKLALTF